MTRFAHTSLLCLSLLLVASLASSCGDDGNPVDAGDDPSGTGDVPSDDGDDPPTDEGPLGAGPYPIADLTIEYEHASAGVTSTYRITCLGDTATVDGDDVGVTDQAACTALAESAVQARLIDGVPTDRLCTENYGGDDTATITGRIDDVAVDTTVDRANGCGIDEWDNLLSDLLPAPIGVQE
ncbi:MAG: hypothetical protein RIB98_04560 [Acidimicrobiales bacterium]